MTFICSSPAWLGDGRGPGDGAVPGHARAVGVKVAETAHPTNALPEENRKTSMTSIRHLSIMDDSDLVDSGDGGGGGGGALPVVAVDVACRGERSIQSKKGGKRCVVASYCTAFKNAFFGKVNRSIVTINSINELGLVSKL